MFAKLKWENWNELSIISSTELLIFDRVIFLTSETYLIKRQKDTPPPSATN